MRLRQVSSEYVHADLEVRIVEVVRYVPTDLSVLSALLDDSVEEAECKDERWKSGMWTLHQGCRIYLEVGVAHVQLQAIWWFCNDLQFQRGSAFLSSVSNVM